MCIRDRYWGDVKINHVDLYRIENNNLEAHDLGFEEMLEDSVVLVEWYENAKSIFSDEHIRIEFKQGANGPDSRVIELEAVGKYYENWINKLVTEVANG